MTFKDELRQLRLEKELQEEVQRKNQQKGLDLEEVIRIEFEKVCKRQEEAEKKAKSYVSIVNYCRCEAKKGKMYAKFIVVNNNKPYIFIPDDTPRMVIITKEDLEYVSRKNKFYIEYNMDFIRLWFEFGKYPFFKHNENSLLKGEIFEIWRNSQVANPETKENQALRFFCREHAVENDSKEISINAMLPLPDRSRTYIQWIDIYAFCILHDMLWDGKRIDFCLEDEVD